LLAAGVPERAIVSPPEAAGRFDSEALWAELAPRRDWRDQRVWIVRGEGGRNWLSDELAAVGAHVRHVTAYRRAAPRWDAAERAVLDRALAEPQRHVWLFSSSEAVGHWPQGLNAGAHRAVATHARIAEAARRQGMDQVRLAPPQVSAIADAVRAFGQLPAGDPPSPTAPAPRSADGS
jgi:uroporphyrinogen-III synthase